MTVILFPSPQEGAWGFFMVVYIEYAFLWNFLLDSVLLRLSLFAVRQKAKKLRLCFSALLGASFALIFPLLSLPIVLSFLLKFSVGALLCLVGFGRIKNKKEWGRYALSCTFFFAFTFAFGGAIVGVFGENPKKGIVLLAISFLTVVSLLFIKKLYERRAVTRYVYDCAIAYREKSLRVEGFYDSGNLATYNGLPVCFVSPDVFYELWGEEIAFSKEEIPRGEMGEIALITVSGEKRATVRLGKLKMEVEKGKTVGKEVYFSPSKNMVLRDYKLLLHSRIFEEEVLDKINER